MYNVSLLRTVIVQRWNKIRKIFTLPNSGTNNYIVIIVFDTCVVFEQDETYEKY